uniref:Uncharacterized protein n=1 Tax=viral metagenome TaxID=1070528 RepID=A0A6M3L241_9ZZZZ
MAKKRKVAAKRRVSSAAAGRPIIVNLPARRNPGARRSAPKRSTSGRFVKTRRNPVGLGSMAGAVIVNPAKKSKQLPRNPGLVKSIIRKGKGMLTSGVLVPIVVGVPLGILSVAAFDKYVAPRMSGLWSMLLKVIAGLVSIPLGNKISKSSGFYSGGLLIGSAIKDWLLKWIPLGDGLGNTDWLGEAGGEDLDGLDEVSDGGVEDILGDAQGNAVLVDGLGVLPPVPIPIGPRMMRVLRRRRLAWLLRLLSPDKIAELMSLPPLKRKAAIRELRAMYQSRKGQIEQRQGAQHVDTPAVMAHPQRRAQQQQQQRFKAQQRQRFAGGRGRGRGLQDVSDDEIGSSMGWA